jgi:hypothetical protein
VGAFFLCSSAGRYGPTAGATVCADCPAGLFMASDQGFAECNLCPSARYNNEVGRTACDICPPRTIRLNPYDQSPEYASAAVECDLCDPGYISVSTRLSCEPCTLGKYQVGDDCVGCNVTANVVQQSLGASSCDRCE